jgi:hypothetical protein
MCPLPKPDKLIKMLGRQLQNVLYIASSCIAGAYGIASVRQRNLPPRCVAKLHNHLNLGIKPVNMARLMIFRIRDKPYTVELE